MYETESVGMCEYKLKSMGPEWSYVKSRSAFVWRPTKKITAIININWSCKAASLMTQPSVWVQQADVIAAFELVVGRKLWTLCSIRPGYLDHDLQSNYTFYEVDNELTESSPRHLNFSQAPDILDRIVAAGPSILDKYFDFSSDRSFLENYPKFYDADEGLAYCIIQVMLGTPGFIDEYLSPDFMVRRRRLTDDLGQGVKDVRNLLKIKANIVKIPVLTD